MVPNRAKHHIFILPEIIRCQSCRCLIFRSSHRRCSPKKTVPKNFAFRPATLLKTKNLNRKLLQVELDSSYVEIMSLTSTASFLYWANFLKFFISHTTALSPPALSPNGPTILMLMLVIENLSPLHNSKKF